MSKAVQQLDTSASDEFAPTVAADDPQPAEAIPRPHALPSRNSPHAEIATTKTNPWRQLLLNRGDQLFVAFAVTVMLTLMLVHWMKLSGWGLKPVEIERLEPLEYTFRIDVNRATWVEWSQLEGVGQVLARRIVADREEHGPFRSIDDVQRVKGVGRKKLEQLSPWLTIEQSTSEK